MIFADLLCCLAPKATPAAPPSEQYDAASSKCVFCNPTPDRFEIVMQDADHVVFRDRSPAALLHLLAIPRRHIDNVQSLQGLAGSNIVRSLQSIGQRALSVVRDKGQEANEVRFGFHIPPFRSVNHLHLHCLVLPFRSPFKSWKYRMTEGNTSASPPTAKGWGWFVTPGQAIQILERGEKIKVQPC